MSIHKQDVLFSGRNAFKHLDFLAQKLKNRLAGSEGERKAISYIENEFKKIGLKTKKEKVDIVTYQPKKALVEVVGRKKLIIKGQPVGLSKSTSLKGIKGELAFLESGDVEYLPAEMREKILIISGGLGGYKKFKMLKRFNPKALVIVERTPGKDPARVELIPEWKRRNFPILRISYHDGIKLIHQRGKKANIVCRSSQKKATSYNIIAKLKGNDHPEEIIVIGAHVDSSWEGPGAADNAGGVAVMLELARVLMKVGSKRTVSFIGWGAEELGLKGSIAHVRRLKRSKKKLKRYKLNVNIDVQGGLIGKNEAYILGSEELVSSVRLLSKEKGPPFNIRESVYSSDGMSFSKLGIPSVSFARGGGSTQFLHTTKDEIGHLSEDALALQGEFIEIWLRRYVTQGWVFPFTREIPEKLKKEINNFFEEKLGTTI